MPYEAIAYDIAADAEKAGSPQLVLFAIFIGGTKDCFIDLLVERKVVVLVMVYEELVEHLIQPVGRQWSPISFGNRGQESGSGETQVFGTNDVTGADE